MTGKLLQEKTWVINAELDRVEELSQEISAWLVKLGLPEHVFAMQMLVHEALNNAVLHGSSCDPGKQVRCQLRLDEEAIYLQVSDGGPGFDWRAAMQQEMAPVEQENGRGLWLYRLYASHFEFNENGNQISLIRRRK